MLISMPYADGPVLFDGTDSKEVYLDFLNIDVSFYF